VHHPADNPGWVAGRPAAGLALASDDGHL